ncbi:TetR/AcrR family transcriptional regulator [Candidatus Bathyarchaeota archaeon]|nr:TetR/AcrR family transcriptional regulator [Candidatus Bathyarchaeota archaeon]
MSPKISVEQKNNVKDRILNAAETLFMDKGFKETSMDDIVKESNMSKGAIYGHFNSKDELILTLYEKKIQSNLSQINIALPKGSSSKQKLHMFIDTAIETCKRPKEFQRMNIEFFIEASRKEKLIRKLNDRYSITKQVIENLIKEGIERGEFRDGFDPDRLAALLFALGDGLSLHWATMGVDYDWEKLKATLFETILQGIEVKKHFD